MFLRTLISGPQTVGAKLRFLCLIAFFIFPGDCFWRDSMYPTTTKQEDYYTEGNTYDFVSRTYNRQLRPKEGGETDIVDIGMFVNSVRTISEIDMTVILDVFLQAEWSDHRLNWTWEKFYKDHIRYNMPQKCMEENCYLKEMTLGKDFASAIWRPDFYLPDAIHIIPADDYNDNVCVRLDPNYHLFYSNRLIITISCIMKLVYFPFDKHICPICIGSYKYHDGLLSMRWSNNLSGMYTDQFTANFFMEGYEGASDYYNKTLPYLSDMFTEHCFNITIHRKYNIFLVTLYLPSVSLVGLSWVNFWIDHKAIPARASLSITAILAQITLIVGMASRFPSVSDLKMADLYLTVNFIYTFGTLVEFAIVSYNPEEKRNRQQKCNSTKAPASSTTVLSNTITNATNNNLDANRNKLSDNNPGLDSTAVGSLNSKPVKSPKIHHMGFGVAPAPSDSDDCILGKDVLHNGSVVPCTSSLGVTRKISATYSPESAGVLAQDPLNPNEYVRLRNRPRSEFREFFNLSPSRPASRRCRKKLPPVAKTRNLDDISKLVFPISFIVWNFIFFSLNLILAEKYCIFWKYFAEEYCERTCKLC